MVLPRRRASQNARTHRTRHRLQRRSPAGRHHAVRKRPARSPFFSLRPRPLLRKTRKRSPPFPHALKRIPRRTNNQQSATIANLKESELRLRKLITDNLQLITALYGFAGAGAAVDGAGADF